jgi:AbrB family looped-hinge helix DNA binding protein
MSDPGDHFATVTRKGQLTIPASVRHVLKLDTGDRLAVSVFLTPRREIRLRRVRSVAEATYGVVPATGRTADLDALRHQFEQAGGREEHKSAKPA